MRRVIVSIACMLFTAACPAWAGDSVVDQLKAAGKSSQQGTLEEGPEKAKAESNKGPHTRNERSLASGSFDVRASSETATVTGLTAACATPTASRSATAARCKNTCDCPGSWVCCPTANGYCGCFPFSCP
jgi:hypothetical protein